MDELIRKQDAIDALGERPMVWVDNDDYSLGQRNQYDLDKLAIETVPSAQPVIIRCKDCKFYTGDYCVRIGDDYGAESFCGFAERREAEHERHDIPR